jgi:ligand-binding SRPBCC domain-containing protein
MPQIIITTHIHAPIQRVFDLARSIELHLQTTQQTGEKIVAGRTSGLAEMGDTMTWYAKHLGVWQHLTSEINRFDAPFIFGDRQVKGAFKSFQHDHFFEEKDGGTVMRDVFTFEAPLGMLGRLANVLFLTRYMRKFLLKRNVGLKKIAEGDRWKEILEG